MSLSLFAGRTVAFNFLLNLSDSVQMFCLETLKIINIGDIRVYVYNSITNTLLFKLLVIRSKISRPQITIAFSLALMTVHIKNKNISSLYSRGPSLRRGDNVQHLSQCMRFPTMWQFDICRLGRTSAASF